MSIETLTSAALRIARSPDLSIGQKIKSQQDVELVIKYLLGSKAMLPVGWYEEGSKVTSTQWVIELIPELSSLMPVFNLIKR